MTIERKTKLGLLSTAAALIAGCTPNDTGLGSAARSNYEAQVVEPDPAYAQDQQTSGSQVAGAQERYRTGRVKKPASIRTTDSGAAGSSGGKN